MRLAITVALSALLASFGCNSAQSNGAAGRPAVDVGLVDGYRAALVLDGLMNPSSVSFSGNGALTVCDSGNGQVLLVTDGAAKPYITGFTTEYWKVDKAKNISRFKLGPVSAVWLDGTLAVTDAGLKDGAEVVRFYDGPGAASDGAATNSVSPTSDDPKDKGEGNLSGMAALSDGDTLWVCGQGADSKTWVLRATQSTKALEPVLSADDNGIPVNSPMQVIVWDDGDLLVLYSGKGGAEDGLIVKWSVAERKPVAQWTLPGLFDPMGMAWIPGTDELAVVDNNWALTQVNDGRLARVSLPAGGGAATVTMIGTKLHGPVSCAFGPDGQLYIAQLGAEFDKGLGQVIAVSGF